MSDFFSDRNFFFFNIVPYSPGKEETLAADIIDYFEKTKNDTVLYCLSLHPEGCPAMEKAVQMAESYRKLKGLLEGTGVRLGVLIQSILGHWPRVDKENEPWTRSVIIDGRESRFCILDPGFRKYIFDVTAMVAKEKPVFILGDDDIRSFSLGKPECFCERHTAKFNAMTGLNFTPDEYREAVQKSTPGDKIFEAFEVLRKAIPTETATIMRQAIDSVDPSIPAGTCMPGWELCHASAASHCIAGANQPPVLRVANSLYLESTAKAFPAKLAQTMVYVEYHKDIPYLLDESDTFPHHLFSRSSKGTHAKHYGVIFSGLKGAKLWLVNMRKFGFPIHKNYTKVLGKYHHSYEYLAGEVAKSTFTGLIVPASKKFVCRDPETGDFVTEKFLEEPTLATKQLGITGIPFYTTFDLKKEEIYVLAGEKTVNRFSDEELKTLLAGKLYVDGPAAAELCKRGFEKELGLRAEMTDFLYNRERDVKTKSLYGISKCAGVPFITLLDANCEVTTELCFSPYPSSPALETVAPGTVFYRNALGGMVCVSAFHQDVPYGLLNEARNRWYLGIFDKLNGGKLPVVCLEQQENICLTRRCADGGTMLYMCNLNFDDMEEIRLRFAKTPEKIFRLTPEGKWVENPFRAEGEEVILEWRLGCYDPAVFKF